MDKAHFGSALVSWYRHHHRELPWRQTKDPYRIWISEVVLQQTRVQQGLPYYLSFIENFPEVSDLAQASEQQVLRLWQGLGYYSRARNLHRCSREIMDNFGGQFPTSYHELLSLPGIGDYTASAIASIAFKQSVPVVDGNVFRVLSRVAGIDLDIATPKTRKTFKQLGADLMQNHPPDLFNQGMMEFGALHCTPVQPKCDTCPFSDYCYAFLNQVQQEFPVKSKKPKVRNRYFYYFVIRSGSDMLLKKRTEKDIWQGLYDFMLVEHHQETDPISILESALPRHSKIDQLYVGDPSTPYKHKLTHQNIQACFLTVEPKNMEIFRRWKKQFNLSQFDVSEVDNLPKPILIDNYLKADIF